MTALTALNRRWLLLALFILFTGAGAAASWGHSFADIRLSLAGNLFGLALLVGVVELVLLIPEQRDEERQKTRLARQRAYALARLRNVLADFKAGGAPGDVNDARRRLWRLGTRLAHIEVLLVDAEADEATLRMIADLEGGPT